MHHAHARAHARTQLAGRRQPVEPNVLAALFCPRLPPPRAPPGGRTAAPSLDDPVSSYGGDQLLPPAFPVAAEAGGEHRLRVVEGVWGVWARALAVAGHLQPLLPRLQHQLLPDGRHTQRSVLIPQREVVELELCDPWPWCMCMCAWAWGMAHGHGHVQLELCDPWPRCIWPWCMCMCAWCMCIGMGSSGCAIQGHGAWCTSHCYMRRPYMRRSSYMQRSYLGDPSRVRATSKGRDNGRDVRLAVDRHPITFGHFLPEPIDQQSRRCELLPRVRQLALRQYAQAHMHCAHAWTHAHMPARMHVKHAPPRALSYIPMLVHPCLCPCRCAHALCTPYNTPHAPVRRRAARRARYDG